MPGFAVPLDAALPRRAARWGGRLLQGLRKDRRDAPVILMYHRIAVPPWDPWGLAVPPARFREQLEFLKRHRTVVAMDELVAGLASGSLPPRATAITFDDGYADNALVAKPILEELGVPATFFLTTGFVSSGKRFWWDELAAKVLAGPAPAELELAGMTCAWPAQQRLPGDLAAWRVGQETADPRRVAYGSLWSVLQRMTEAEREAALECLARLLGDQLPLAEDELGRPMALEMVRAAPSDLITLGAHGRSHVPLTALPPAARREELSLARSEIAEWTDRTPPCGIAYPHGEQDAETRELAAAAGYRWAVTSRSARVDPRRYDPLALPRLVPGRRSAGAVRLLLCAAAD